MTVHVIIHDSMSDITIKMFNDRHNDYTVYTGEMTRVVIMDCLVTDITYTKYLGYGWVGFPTIITRHGQNQQRTIVKEYNGSTLASFAIELMQK